MRAQPRGNLAGKSVVVHDQRSQQLERFERLRDGPRELVAAQTDLREVRRVRQVGRDGTDELVVREVHPGEFGAVALRDRARQNPAQAQRREPRHLSNLFGKRAGDFVVRGVELLQQLRGRHGFARERSVQPVAIQVQIHEQRQLREVVARYGALERVVGEERRAKRGDAGKNLG